MGVVVLVGGLEEMGVMMRRMGRRKKGRRKKGRRGRRRRKWGLMSWLRGLRVGLRCYQRGLLSLLWKPKCGS